MLFTTFNFVTFLCVVLALFYAIPQTWRRYLLLAASLTRQLRALLEGADRLAHEPLAPT